MFCGMWIYNKHLINNNMFYVLFMNRTGTKKTVWAAYCCYGYHLTIFFSRDYLATVENT